MKSLAGSIPAAAIKTKKPTFTGELFRLIGGGGGN